MLDFLDFEIKFPKKDLAEVYPVFLIKKSKDLMIKGGDFYAIWVEEAGLWSADEDDVIRLVDKELDTWVEENKARFIDCRVKKLYMRRSSSGVIDSWHKYCQKQLRNNFKMLNETLVFSNTPVSKENYASIRLPYALEPGDCPSWNTIIGTLYSPEERHKIEWCIGSIVTGASKNMQKFLVFYGPKGSGKSTIILIIEKLFQGYWTAFSAKALGSSNDSFALEPFKNGPLIAIQHDGNLSKIEDNTRLNSLVSHETMTVNEKFKSLYANAFKTFLIMGTNDPVRITNAKSGILRRLIDVSPSEQLIPKKQYDILMQQVNFELGAIAWHCMEVFNAKPNYYDNYVPISMMGATNDFYNFVEDSYTIFKKENSVSLKSAWEMYKTYCEDAKVPYPLSLRAFKEELKNYFWEFSERSYTDDGRLRNIYSKFRIDKFDIVSMDDVQEKEDSWLKFEEQPSLLDDVLKEYPAQYATKKGIPSKSWDSTTTVLLDLDTSKLHYVKVPENLIVIDFDIPDEDGNKSFEKNFEAAKLWPKTYAELSKSGKGIHLHYYYKGDISKLKTKFADHIEVKVFTGNAALRRLVSKCNEITIATISSGLPLKDEGSGEVINDGAIKSERGLRNLIARNLRKEIHPGTKPSMDFIKKILDDAYEQGLKYDVSDMYTTLLGFAAGSTNHSVYCMQMLKDLKLKSDEPPEIFVPKGDDDIWFYDIEVFCNLILINFKKRGVDTMYRLINPTANDIEELIRRKLVGFNCRRYDNHILYAILIGYTIEEVYNLSQRIIKGEKNCFFSQAYNISYTDIYDFASAANKMSLKKLEIKMKIHHQELGYDWNEPVPEEKWVYVSEYCDNDVIATEKAFDFLQDDFTAREILAELANMSVNDTTNTLTTKIIFGNNRNPQSEFCYRNLSEPVDDLPTDVEEFLNEACPVMMSQTHTNDGITFSKLPYFPEYTFINGTSTYRERTVGEGGYVYAEPGVYINVALLDIESMHPHSAIAECIFGPRFTRIFREIVEGRVNIKHKAWGELDNILGGKLKPFIQRVIDGQLTAKKLANALKTAINAVYGLTAATFDNPFRDKRNVDNIIAKRGALFMINLEEEIKRRGFTVAHIKTDSIKIPNATPEIIKFVKDYGQIYGYNFVHEATYDRMCLVNNAVYIAKYADAEKCNSLYGYVPSDNQDAIDKDMLWTATGAEFAVPYVFKSLFTKEPIVFDDMCEVKQATKGALYLKDSDEEYQFIGKVGEFTPVDKSVGMELLCLRDEKYYAPPGTKDYYWLESEIVRGTELEDKINREYYDNLVTEAAHKMISYGCNIDIFVSDLPYPFEMTTEYGDKEIQIA